MLPPVDDEFDEVGGLVDVFVEADDDALCVGVAEVVDFAACGGAGLVQLGLGGSCLTAGGSAAPELELVLALGDGEPVVVGVPLGLTLGLTLGLGLGLTLGLTLGLGLGLTLGLTLAEALGLGLGLELAVLLLLALDDVAGAVGLLVAPLGERALVAVWDADADGDVQGPGVMAPATPGAVGWVPTAADGTGLVLWPSVLGGALEELVLLKAELIALPTDIIAWRAGGTTDRSTPTANTAAPTAKAGRSMASRQSLGRRSRRCGSPCRGACRARPRRPTRPAAKPEMASQAPRAPWGRLAWAGRDRILSRIRSRPSAPGST